MPNFFIKHKTEYQYSDIIYESAYKILLYPLNDDSIKVLKHDINVSFHPSIETIVDSFGNTIGTFSVVEAHKKFVIESYIDVITYEKKMPESSGTIEENWQEIEKLKSDFLFFDFFKKTTSIADSTYLEVIKKLNSNAIYPQELALRLCNYVHKTFAYKKNITDVTTTIDKVWELKAGVCQDFTNVLIHLLKLAGLPAKYVSGYICSNANGLIGLGATHAWVEVYIPFYGWLGLDPTNNCMVNDKHVRIATGRNYADCAPVVGIYRGNATNKLKVEVEVSFEKISQNDVTFLPEKPNETQKNSFAKNQQYIQEQQQQ